MRREIISPMLAATAFAPFTRPGWLYEPKFDGIRAVTSIKNGKVTMESRNGLRLNHRFPKLIEDLSLNADMTIDGEIVALDKNGRSRFQLLQQNNIGAKVVYYVFDMLFNDGKRVMEKPLSERKTILAAKLKTTSQVKLVKELPTTGEEAFDSCLRNGMEGIVAKRTDSTYVSGRRCTTWVKVKGNQTAEFVIGGYTEGTGNRFSTFGSLLLGYYDRNDDFRYVGAVDAGFDETMLKVLTNCLKSLRTHDNPFNVDIQEKGRPHYVIPHLVAEVQFKEMTEDNMLHLPVFLRLRDDITVEEAGPRTTLSPPRLRNIGQ